MNNITAILSMLHQGPPRPSSAVRLFRREPVLSWTLRRLGSARSVRCRAILCWDDQFGYVQPIAAAHDCHVLCKSPRCDLAMVQAIAASRRWCDGWRGGLLSATCFDQGFHAAWFNEIRKQLHSDAVVIIDPDSALIDPALIDSLVGHAQELPSIDYCFSPAAPGLSGALIRGNLLDQFAATNGYLGRHLNYFPDLPGRDPIGKEECAPVPTAVARTAARFTLDSDRQVSRIEQATLSLNGQLMQTHAQSLVAAVSSCAPAEAIVRDITLELNTTRATRPVYSPVGHHFISRADLSLAAARGLFCDLAVMDDTRLTFAGVGDPLLCPDVFPMIQSAYDAGIHSIHVETDLVSVDESAIRKLAESPIDLVSVHLPGVTAGTYEQVMGVDALAVVINNIRQFLSHRQSRSRGIPILVPTFAKCRDNLHEMEGWYDHWLRAVGCAVITAASDYAGQIPDQSVAEMSPPLRCPCRRLGSRVSILCDLSIVACEQDIFGRQPLAHLRDQTLRQSHAGNNFSAHPLCPSCRDWHRP